MAQPAGPYTLTAGVEFTERPPQGLLNPPAVIAVNKSPFEIVFNTPIARTLPAWTADILTPAALSPSAPAAAISQVSGIPDLAPGSPTPTGTASLYLDWLGPGENPPAGLYPLSLIADAIAGSVTALLNNDQLLLNTSLDLTTVTSVQIDIPAGVTALGIYIAPLNPPPGDCSVGFNLSSGGQFASQQGECNFFNGSAFPSIAYVDCLSNSGAVTLSIIITPSTALGPCTFAVVGYPATAAELLGNGGVPVHVTPSVIDGSVGVVSSTLGAVFAKIVNPPGPPGVKRIIETIAVANATATDVIGFSLDGSNDHYAVTWEPGYPGIAPGWIIRSGSSNGLWVHNHAGARGNAYVVYHDEPL